jgi:hypothetical protein
MLIANLRRTQTLSARGCQNESKVNPDISYPPIVRLPASRHIVGGHNAMKSIAFAAVREWHETGMTPT